MARRHKSDMESDTIPTDDHRTGPTRFRRTPADESDVAAVAARGDQIVGSLRLGLTPSQIGRALGLKVDAVERFVRGNPPQATPSPAVPPGAMMERPAHPPKIASLPETPTALAELLGGASEKGSYADTMKLMRETASTDLLSSFLQEQLEEKRLANRQHRLEIERLERGGGRGDGGADRADGSVFSEMERTRENELKRAWMEAEIVRIRSGGSAGGEVERLRAENAVLAQRQHDQSMLESFAKYIAPLRAEVENLRARPSKMTMSDVEVSAAAAAESNKNAAVAGFVNVLTEKARNSGAGQALVGRVLASPKTTERLLDTLDRATLSDDEYREHKGELERARNTIPLPPTPQQLAAMTAAYESLETPAPPVVDAPRRVFPATSNSDAQATAP